MSRFSVLLARETALADALRPDDPSARSALSVLRSALQLEVAGLVEAGAVRSGNLVKVLGTGDVAVALNVSAHAFSGSAKAKLEAAGGSVTEL